MCSNYTMESYLTINEMGMPDLLPDVIPKERRPSGPPEEPDIEFEEDNPHLIGSELSIWYDSLLPLNRRRGGEM